MVDVDVDVDYQGESVTSVMDTRDCSPVYV